MYSKTYLDNRSSQILGGHRYSLEVTKLETPPKGLKFILLAKQIYYYNAKWKKDLDGKFLYKLQGMLATVFSFHRKKTLSNQGRFLLQQLQIDFSNLLCFYLGH